MPNTQKGFVSIFVLGFVVVLVVLVSVFLLSVTFGLRNVQGQKDNIQTLYLAEAGLNKAVWYLTNTAPDGTSDGSWRTASYPADAGPDPNDPQQGVLGDGYYVMWVENSGADILITSRATVGDIIRTVQQEIDISGYPISVSGTWKEI